ncbi:MAG: hypothetical protein WAN08_02670 [Candidatus Sulfotelmatobacter sp.]
MLSSLTIVSRDALAQDAPGQQSPPAQGNSQPEQSPKPEQSSPEQSKDEKKDEVSNPGQFAAEKTKEVSVEAAHATKKMGQAALDRAREWERGWLTGVYVGERRTLVPLTLKQRREVYLQQTLTTPGAYMKRMFAADIDQTRGVPAQWDDGWDGYVERFASREGQFIAANTLAYLGNAAKASSICVHSGRCMAVRLVADCFRPHGNRNRATRSPKVVAPCWVRPDTAHC